MDQSFGDWLKEFSAAASGAGLKRAVLDDALSGLAPQPDVLARDRAQPEAGLAIWDYLDRAVTPGRIAFGRRQLAAHSALFAEIETRFGVPPAVLCAIWGMESDFGRHRGSTPTLAALATLAHEGRRRSFFEAQLIAALKIVASGAQTATGLTGSWAGAMGHTQLMPTSYLDHGCALAGERWPDVWCDDPSDALASAASVLRGAGWQRGIGWGSLVDLPRTFNHSLDNLSARRSPREWADAGLSWRHEIGSECELLLPAGISGPAFLVTGNFGAILRYNRAISYALAVAVLSDALATGEAVALNWPHAGLQLSRAEMEEIQRLLTVAGYDAGGMDGICGSATRAAIARYQQDLGLPADGFADRSFYDRLVAGVLPG